MKNLVLVVFIFSFPMVFHSQEEKKIIGDFNKDGMADTLKWFYDGGSGFGGNYYTLTNGKSKEIFKVDNWGCFCSAWTAIPVPPGLLKPENKGLLDTLTGRMFAPKAEKPDPTLKWIMEAAKSRKPLAKWPSFDLYLRVKPYWVNKTEKIENWYYMELEAEEFSNMYSPEGENTAWCKNGKCRGWISYTAFHYNPSGLKIKAADSNEIYKAIITPHAVIVQKDNMRFWPFITDNHTTGSPDKLRWASVKKVKLIGNYMIVERNLPADVFVVDLLSGSIGRINCGYVESTEIKDNKLMITIEGTIRSYDLKMLFLELKRIEEEQNKKK